MLRDGDSVILASEPYDNDPRWTDIPDHHLVDARPGAVTLTDLTERRQGRVTTMSASSTPDREA